GITVNPLPVISVSPAAASICSGESVDLTASGAASFTWNPNTGLSAASGSTVTANPTISTTYTVVGTDAGGCSNSSTPGITVNPLPVVSVSPAAASICSG